MANAFEVLCIIQMPWSETYNVASKIGDVQERI